MTATFIVQYMGQGLAAARPVTPLVTTGALAIYQATDTGALSLYYGAAWHTLSAGDPSIAGFLTIPANPGFDPLYTGKAAAVVLSSSNKVATPASGSPYNHMMGTPANYTGKRYFELIPGATGFTNLGFVGAQSHLKNGDGANLGEGVAAGAIGIASAGGVKVTMYGATSFTLTTLATWAAGDVVSFALDLDAALFWIRTNAGNWNNNAGANPATGTLGQDLSWAYAGSTSKLIWPAMNAGSTTAQTMRLKAADFTQAMPAGFAAWAT